MKYKDIITQVFFARDEFFSDDSAEIYRPVSSYQIFIDNGNGEESGRTQVQKIERARGERGFHVYYVNSTAESLHVDGESDIAINVYQLTKTHIGAFA